MQNEAKKAKSKWTGPAGLLLVSGLLVSLFLLIGFAATFGLRRFSGPYSGVKSKPAILTQAAHELCQSRMLKLGNATERGRTLERPPGFSDDDCRCPVTHLSYESFFLDDKRFIYYCPGHRWKEQFVYYASSDSQIHSDSPNKDWADQLVSSHLWRTIDPRKSLELALSSLAGAKQFPGQPLLQCAQLATELGRTDILQSTEPQLDQQVNWPIARCQRVANLAILGRKSEAKKLAQSLTSDPTYGDLAKVLLADLEMEDGQIQDAESLYRESKWDNSGEAWAALIRRKPEQAHRLSCQQLEKFKFSKNQSAEWLRIALISGRFLGGEAESTSKRWLAQALEQAPQDENYSGLQYFNGEMTAETYLLHNNASQGRLNVASFNVGAWQAAQKRPQLARVNLEKVRSPYTYERLVALEFLKQ